VLSLSAIRQISRDAAVRAARDNRIPFTVEPQDLADWKARFKAGNLKFPFPFLGNYVPQGWKRTDRPLLFVDSSGQGREDEPALTVTATIDALIPGRAYAVIETGQFQLYVAEYERDDSSGGNADQFLDLTSEELEEFEAEFGEPPKHDIRVRFDGSLALFEILTKRAQCWVRHHVTDPQFFGRALVCEWRYAKSLAAGMKKSGLRLA
jgi:hypothetical protein